MIQRPDNKKLFLSIVALSFITSVIATCLVLALASQSFQFHVSMKPLTPKVAGTVLPEFSKEQQALLENPCYVEENKFCKGAEQEPGGMSACLLDYLDQSSPSCRELLQPALDRWIPCNKEIETYCKGVRPGRMRLGKCLRSHLDNISKQCLAVINARN